MDQPSNIDTNTIIPTSAFPDDRNISPNTRRNRDLAHVLFGAEDDLADDALPYLLHRNPSAPRIPQTPQEYALSLWKSSRKQMLPWLLSTRILHTLIWLTD